MHWGLVTLLICTHGLFKEFRPTDSYLTMYFTDNKLISMDTVNSRLYPSNTYAYLLGLLPVLLFTDYLRYKPIIVIGGAALIVAWALTLWTTDIKTITIAQVLIGISMATEIGYHSYLYPAVDRNRYSLVASMLRCSLLSGRILSSLFGQLFISVGILDLDQLTLFTFCNVSLSFITALCLPRTGENTEVENETEASYVPNGHIILECRGKIYSTYNSLACTFRNQMCSYSPRTVKIWSFFWVFASLGNFQIGNYAQNIWNLISTDTINNGAVELAATIAGFLFTGALAFLPTDWTKAQRTELIMTVLCILKGVCFILSGVTSNIWTAYGLFVLLKVVVQLGLTIEIAEIAKAVNGTSYGFVFGCNMFLALVVESLFTAIVIDEAGLGIGIRTQFVVVGSYSLVCAMVFALLAVVSAATQKMASIPNDTMGEDEHREMNLLQSDFGTFENENNNRTKRTAATD